MKSFYTDIIRCDHRFNSPGKVNDIALLEPVTRQSVLSLIDEAATHGLKLMVWETYRSQLRQQILFYQNVSELKKIGVHHFGLACDIVKNVGGMPSWEGDFTLLGKLARTYGLVWGGDWKSRDTVHVQRCSIDRQAALFALEWYPDAAYDPYSDMTAATSRI